TTTAAGLTVGAPECSAAALCLWLNRVLRGHSRNLARRATRHARLPEPHGVSARQRDKSDLSPVSARQRRTTPISLRVSARQRGTNPICLRVSARQRGTNPICLRVSARQRGTNPISLALPGRQEVPNSDWFGSPR